MVVVLKVVVVVLVVGCGEWGQLWSQSGGAWLATTRCGSCIIGADGMVWERP